GQVADMAETGQDFVVTAQIFVDCLGLSRGFDNDDVHGMGAGLLQRRGKLGGGSGLVNHTTGAARRLRAAVVRLYSAQMQPENAGVANPQPNREDVAAYIAAMSRQLAQVCLMAGMDEAARL